MYNWSIQLFIYSVVGHNIQQPERSTTDSETALEPPSTLSNTTSQVMAKIERLPEIEQLDIISHSFHQFALKYYDVDIEFNFLEVTLLATKHLSMCSRSNVIYKLTMGIGTMHPNGLD